MPNRPDNDNELSALLNKAEPPQSPAHLDAEILQYAREHAPTAPKHALPGSGLWLQRNWITATATLAVATIAISVSLQFLAGPESVRTAELSRTEELTLGISQTDISNDVAMEVAIEVENKAANEVIPAVLADAELESDTSAIAANGANRELLEPSLATSALEARLRQEVATADAPAIAATAAPAIADSVASVDSTATSAALSTRRSNAAELPAAPPVESNLATLLTSDTALQDTVIIALRRALGVREQSVAVRRGRFLDEMRIYLETYRGLSNATILDNVQNRYGVAKSELLDARLPGTIAELVALLEMLIATQ